MAYQLPAPLKKQISGLFYFFLFSSTAYLAPVAVFGQPAPVKDYIPLKNEERLPADFTQTVVNKYKKDLSNISSVDSRRDKKTKAIFYLENNFGVQQLLRGGKVVYEKKYSAYLKEIVARLVPNQPDVLRNLRVYLVESPSVNAFAVDQGIIFVNIGLLAQVENEAELGFVLAHELAHIIKKHSVVFALKSDRIGKDASRNSMLKSADMNEHTIARLNFSKEQEAEADIFGAQTLARSAYSISGIDKGFDMLRYSYLPFANIPLDKTFFNTPDLVIPDSLFDAAIPPIKGMEEKDDDGKSAHPNLFKRRAAVAQLLKGTKDTMGRKDFLVSKEKFEALRNIARFEICDLYLQHHQLKAAIYSAYLLLQKNPGNLYLQKNIGKALYTLTKYRNNEETVKIGETRIADSVEGESHPLYSMLEKLNQKETNVLALSYLWKFKKQYPADLEIKEMTDDVFKELVDKHVDRIAYFSTVSPDTSKRTRSIHSDSLALKSGLAVKNKPDDIAGSDSSVNRIKKGNRKKIYYSGANKRSKDDQIIKIDSSLLEHISAEIDPLKDAVWLKYAFVSALKDSMFRNTFNYYADLKKKDKEEIFKKAAEYERYERRRDKYGAYLGLPKVVIVDPFYVKLDYKRNEEMNVRFVQTEEGHSRFIQILSENASLAGIAAPILDPATLKETETAKFNDIVALNAWLSEEIDAGETRVVGYRQAQINEIAKRYGTDYFVWTGVVSAHVPKNYSKAALGLVFPPAYALTLATFVEPSYECYYIAVVYDVKTGRRETVKSQFMKKKDFDMVLNAHTYDLFNQLKTSRK